MLNSMEPLIQVKNLSKRYNITHQKGQYVALRDILTFAIKHPLKTLIHRANKILGRTTKEDFWALKDVNFSINKGEVVGVIGRNGAGKSTLLKILTKITPPTEGEVTMTGRVASLLEVGTGFHPELSGRENIFLNGAILGMTRREIAGKFDSIVEFSGIGKFIDTPVKRYSSGMYVRLAFSVAAHLEPDILLIDEVLAVGDAEFQRKCLGKMEEVTNKDGRTILFVSHNMSAIHKICSKSILLDKGKIIMQGKTKDVVEKYLSDEYQASGDGARIFPLTEGVIDVNDFSIIQNGIKTNYIDNDNPFTVKINFKILKDTKFFRLGIYIKNPIGDITMRSTLSDWGPEIENIKEGEYEASLQFPEKLLMAGSYFFVLYGGIYGTTSYFSKHNVYKIITISRPTNFNTAHPDEPISSNPSNVMLKNSWTTKKL